jgi:egghead protein (zeste-white 4 protein)
MLYIRFVTRGTNPDAIRRSISRTHEIVGDRATLQVVTDSNIPRLQYAEQIVVPTDYTPANGAKWKARALHYATVTRPVAYTDYVLHLDEESIITPKCLSACLAFRGSIGQGEIIYSGHGYKPWNGTCAADALRTGDDVIRFKAQYKLGYPIFGSHGSFLLVSGCIEQTIGWDLGAGGSITEDAAFALTAWVAGFRFSWIDGQIIEQSPYTFTDFVKQRRRWFNGLWIVATCPAFPLRYRFVLLVSMIYWMLSPLILFASVLFFALAIVPPLFVRVGLLVSLVYYFIVYAVGGWRNGKMIGMIASLIRMPISFVYEACGVLYGVFRPIATFEIVDKN